MHIRDYLHDIPLRALKTIAHSLDVSVVYEARIKLINAIDRAFWDGGLIERLMKRLSPEHLRLLQFIAFTYDSGAEEQTLFKTCERQIEISSQTISQLLDDLIMYGLVGCIGGEEKRYFCPGGVVEQIRKRFLDDIYVHNGKSDTVPPASAPNLLEDIFSLLALVYKSEISLTLTGNLRKSVLERAFTGSLTCRNCRGMLSEDVRNTIVTDYLTSRELVKFEHKTVHTTERLSGWLDLSMTERYHDIVSFLLTHILEDEYAVIALSGILSETPAGTGITLEGVAPFLATNTLSQGGVVRIESRLRSLLSCLSQLGLLSNLKEPYIVTDTGERFFTLESLPIDENISGDFTIQPNFEVIVGPELDPRVRFRLELIADRMNRDMVLTYAVTGEAIGRARERGMTVNEILAFFRDHARNEIPQNVIFSIESWAHKYGSVYFEDAVLMRCRDAAICDSLIHMPELAPYIRERLAPTVLIVSGEQVATITGIVKDAGFQPELYGTSVSDNAISSMKYMPITLSKMLDQHRMPEFNADFSFPDHLIENQDET